MLLCVANAAANTAVLLLVTLLCLATALLEKRGGLAVVPLDFVSGQLFILVMLFVIAFALHFYIAHDEATRFVG